MLEDLGESLDSIKIQLPRFLRREGNMNFRVLNEIFEPVKGELTTQDFQKCLGFNSLNHLVSISPKKDDKENQENSEYQKNTEEKKQDMKINSIGEISESLKINPKESEDNKTRIISKMVAREALLEKMVLLYGDAKKQIGFQEEYEIKKDSNPEEEFANLFKKIELGRQSVLEGRNKERILKENKKKAEAKTQVKKTSNEDDLEPQKLEATIQIQKLFLGYRDKLKVKQVRKLRMEFLGLNVFNGKEPMNGNISLNKLNEHVNRIGEDRKEKIEEKIEELFSQKKKIREELIENEGPEIMEKMLQERRDFILDYFEMHEGKQLPLNEKVFYDRFNLKDPKTLEEEAKQKKKKNNSSKANQSEKIYMIEYELTAISK